MKQILFTLLLFCTVGLLSCRKNNDDIDIKQYDDQQIKAYIAANGLTGMTRDLTGGDTTGIYYKILTPGTGKTISYPDIVSLVFTMKSLDGQYVAADTISNPTLTPHVYNYVGHLTANQLPEGVELALVNIIKQKGGRARILIPSRLAFGVNGFGSGSSSSGNRIAGNQSLDFYINLINDDKVKDPVTGLMVNGQDVYDDISVKNYITASNLTGYTAVTTGPYKGLYYKVTQAGSGAAITLSSLVTVEYTSFTFNGFQTTDQYNNPSNLVIDMANETRKGLVGGLLQVTPGAKLSLIMPSRLAFANTAYADNSIPFFSCLRYEMNILSVQ